MTTPHEICRRAGALGLRLERRGEKLAVIPGSQCPPDLVADLRRHKTELLDYLEAKAVSLPDDCAPWLHVAKQVLAGEWDDADKSTVESLTIGLRGISHPLCARALVRLPRNAQKPATG
jgi:hypothetical protein